MNKHQIKKIAVIGAGLMGHGIALEIAAAGYHVNLYDVTQDILDAAKENIDYGLKRLVDSGKIKVDEISKTKLLIKTSNDLGSQLRDVDLVIEAAPENVSIKQELFKKFGELCPSHTILASNTSSLKPSLYASHSKRPDKVLVMHYANPPHLVPLVEIVRSDKTSDTTVNTAKAFIEGIGKNVIVVNKEVEGFILNRLQIALLRESLWLVENGITDIEGVDKAIKYCTGRRWAFAGIFEVWELAGWDTIEKIYREVAPTLASKTDIPAPLKRLIDKGLFGSKSGQGFYKSDKNWTDSVKTRIAKGLASFK
ncbi:MAG: 3-hydroxybutyryl-CoA dehydrogenase [Chloroflexi bacterium]|jgi:3-hydroxybutyryl-CoA dehydrogenase|nr:MAG: 3-hydroxybutyryl-CoA dehydrogenase [Chloroflexota bacterium]